MFASISQNPWGRWKLLTAVICCLAIFLAPGCTQKVGWRPPDEPTVKPPAPEPPPRVEYQLFYVAADRLNLRACPGMDCPRITTLNRNQEVEKVGESQGWFQVRSRHDGTLGWVDARYLAGSPVPESAVLPTETAAPKSATPPEAKPAEAKPEPKIKVRTSTPAATEDEEPAPPPKRQRVPEAQAAEPPAKAEPAPETPAIPAPAAPSEPAKKKIRIM